MSDTSLTDQLNQGIDALLAGRDGEVLASGSAVAELLAVADSLRTAARPEFKAQLKSDLLEQTVLNPVPYPEGPATPCGPSTSRIRSNV